RFLEGIAATLGALAATPAAFWMVVALMTRSLICWRLGELCVSLLRFRGDHRTRVEANWRGASAEDQPFCGRRAPGWANPIRSASDNLFHDRSSPTMPRLYPMSSERKAARVSGALELVGMIGLSRVAFLARLVQQGAQDTLQR